MKLRYKITYPFEGNVFYAENINKAIPLCHKEFAEVNDIDMGMFKIKELDTNIEHQFLKNKDYLQKIHQHAGKSKNKNKINNKQDGGYNILSEFNNNLNKLSNSINKLKKEIHN